MHLGDKDFRVSVKDEGNGIPHVPENIDIRRKVERLEPPNGLGLYLIRQLVDRVNEDPRRGIGHEKVLTRLVFDHQALRLLEQKGYDEESVPPDGEVVYLRSTGNLSTGGTASDVTDLVHPDNRDMAVRAAQAIGLDVAGVDFLTTDISRSYKETGGAICEVKKGSTARSANRIMRLLAGSYSNVWPHRELGPEPGDNCVH